MNTHFRGENPLSHHISFSGMRFACQETWRRALFDWDPLIYLLGCIYRELAPTFQCSEVEPASLIITSYTPALQTNPIRIAHSQEQFQITVLGCRQRSLRGFLCGFPRLLENPSPMIPKKTRQNSDELDLGEFGPRAVLRAV